MVQVQGGRRLVEQQEPCPARAPGRAPRAPARHPTATGTAARRMRDARLLHAPATASSSSSSRACRATARGPCAPPRHAERERHHDALQQHRPAHRELVHGPARSRVARRAGPPRRRRRGRRERREQRRLAGAVGTDERRRTSPARTTRSTPLRTSCRPAARSRLRPPGRRRRARARTAAPRCPVRASGCAMTVEHHAQPPALAGPAQQPEEERPADQGGQHAERHLLVLDDGPREQVGERRARARRRGRWPGPAAGGPDRRPCAPGAG